MAAVWGAEGMRWPGVLRLSPPAWTMLAIGFLGFWSWLTWLQTATWRNTQTLWSHATLAIPGNHPVHWMLASYYLSRRQFESAYQESLAAYRIRPQYPRYAASVGYALINMRKYPQALFAYSLVLANPTTDNESLVKIGTVVMLYSPRDAQPYFERAEQQGKAKPDQHYYEAMFNHGLTLTAHGRMEEAESRFSRLFQGKPELIRGRCQAALALFEPANAKGLARFPLTADASEHFSNFFPGAYAMIAKYCRPALEGPGG
jgi:tetratricopeptide (TPR) repeat protein